MANLTIKERRRTGGAILTAQRPVRRCPDFGGIPDKVSVVIPPRISGDTGAPDDYASTGPGGGQSEYPARS